MKLKESMVNLFRKHQDFLKTFIFYGTLGGLFVNYIFWGLFNVSFTWYTIPAYGLGYNFLKEDIVPLIRSIFR